jgi:subtilisin family serine protease
MFREKNLKSRVAFLVVLSLFTGVSHAKYKKAEALMDVPGKKTVMVETGTTSTGQLIFNYKIPDPDLETLREKFEGETVKRLYLGNAPLSGDEGKPVLPVVPAQFIIPAGKTIASIEVKRNQKKSLSGKNFVEFGKAKMPLMKDAKFKRSVPDPEIYQNDAAYPSLKNSTVSIQKKRGIHIAFVTMNPVQYNPKSGKIAYYSNLELCVTLKDENIKEKNSIPVRKYGLNVSSLGVENPEAIETYTNENRTLSDVKTTGICSASDEYSYVLITSETIRDSKTVPSVHDLIAQRQAQGLSATIVTIEEILSKYTGVDDAEKLRNFIIDAYSNWNTQYVVLGGDVSIIPYRNLYSNFEYIPGDIYFQCLDGSFNYDWDNYWGEPIDGEGGTDVDLMSEVSIGRISAETPDEMANFIYKTLTYENLPAATPSLTHACMIGEVLGPQFGSGEFEFATPYMEEIRLGSSASGYTTKGFIDCPAFAVDTLYDNSYFWGRPEIKTLINSDNYSIINHLGHGAASYCMRIDPYDVDSLVNTKPLFIYSQGCYTGLLLDDCMADHFTTSTRSGMFAGVFNTAYGWGNYNNSRETLDGPSQRFNRQYWDAFFNEYFYRIGDMNADSHEDNIWCINTEYIRYCMYETTLFGDPYTMLRGFTQGPSLVYYGQSISETSGNGDQFCNPGESVDFSVIVKNAGSEASKQAQCILTGSDQFVTIRSANSNLPSINCCGTTASVIQAFQLDISKDCQTPYIAHFNLNINAGDSNWTLDVPLNVFRSSSIHGNVVANSDQKPVSGASVCYRGPLSGNVTSGTDGSYSCNLIEGTYSFWVNASGYLVSDTVVLSIPPEAKLDFRMLRPRLSVSPVSISEEIRLDDSLDIAITLTNNGDAPLMVTALDSIIRRPYVCKNPLLIKSESKRSESQFASTIEDDSVLIPNVYHPLKNSDLSVKVLYFNTITSDNENDYFTTGLKSIPYVTSVDIVNGTNKTPNLDYLMQYDCVVIASNDYWADSKQLGDVLAEYVDRGRLVIVLGGGASIGGWAVGGRFKERDYLPVLPGGSLLNYFCFASSFIPHQITKNVTSIRSGVVSTNKAVQGDGVALGEFTCDSYISAAYNPSRPIIAINAFPMDGYWDGDLIQMVSNSIEWGCGKKWLKIEPEDAVFTIQPGTSETFVVKMNSLTLEGGQYTGGILLTHNDPGIISPFIIPVSMNVDGFRSLDVTARTITFDRIWYGNSDTMTLTLVNNGSEPTTVSSISSDNNVFTCIHSMPIRINPKRSSSVSFIFTPSGIGNFAGTITVNSNAEDNSSIAVEVNGTAAEGPNAVVSPEALSFTFKPGDTPADRTVVLSNTGVADLKYCIRMHQTNRTVFQKAHATTTNVNNGLIYNKKNYEHPFVDNTVLVGLKKGKTAFAYSNLLSQIGVESVAELAKGINPVTKMRGFDTRILLKMKLYSTGKNAVLDVIQKLRSDPNVEYAEPDYIVKAIGIPNDQYFDRLHGMHNVGQTGGKADADIDAVEAWDSFTGFPDELLIGVIDTGIDYLHPDLVDNMWKNPGEVPDNGIDDDGNGFIDDYYGWDFAYDDHDPIDGYGHGTHCSGTIAAKGNNDIGVAGVMWDAKVMAIKFLDDFGSGTTSDAIDAINYATIMNVNVTNNSWGGGGYSRALEEAIASSGLFVAAAGNSESDIEIYVDYPASYTLENIITVAATDQFDDLAYFSNYGKYSVDLCAPGVEILSTVPDNQYKSKSGTSMAAPHVTGAVALLWSNNPLLNSMEVKDAILQSVDKIPTLEDKTVSGGRLNIEKMLESAGNNWLTVKPVNSGTIVSSGSEEFTITANPEKMAAGHWTAEVVFKTDDPFHKNVTVGVTADVAGCKSIEAQSDLVNFGRVWENRDTIVNIMLVNHCNDNVTILKCTFDNLAYTTNKCFPVIIKPFGSVKIPVTFSPAVAGTYTGNVLFLSDADDNPSLSVRLSGAGITPPDISINPEHIKKSIPFGIIDTTAITLSNSGEADYHYKAKIKVPQKTSFSSIADATLFGAVWNMIYKLDPTTWEPVDSIELGDISRGINELAFDGKYLYFTENNSVTVIDPVTKVVIKKVVFEGNPAFGPIGVSTDNIFVYNYKEGNILTIEKRSGEVINRCSINNVNDITFSESRNSIFVLNDYDMIMEERNSTTGELIDSFRYENGLSSIGYSSFTDILFARDWDGRIIAYNPDNGTVIEKYLNRNLYSYIAADEATAGVKWIHVEPRDGVTPGGNTFSLGAIFDTRNLFAGNYGADIVLVHKSGLLPDITIPCTLSVGGEKHLSAVPESVAFGEVWKGRSDSTVVYLVNNGNEPTVVSSVVSSSTVFTTTFSGAVTIGAFDSIPLKIRCTPVKEGTVKGILKITSNANDNPKLSLQVSVTAVKPPNISVTPSSIAATMLPQQQADYSIKLKNTGGADYAFKTSVFVDETGNSNAGAIYGLGNGLVKIDPATGFVIDTILDNVNAACIAFDGEYVYLGVGWENLIMVVDPDKKQIIDTILTSVYVVGLAVTEDKLIESDFENVYLIDKNTGITLTHWALTTYFGELTYCSDRNSVFLYNFYNQMIEEHAIDDGKLINSFEANVCNGTLAYSTSMQTLMVLNCSSIDYLNPENGDIQGTINVENIYYIASDEVNSNGWIKCAMRNGTVKKNGGTASIGVNINSSGLLPGIYNGKVIIEHEKGWAPGPFVVNCKLKVKSQKLVEVLPESINFGRVVAGTASTVPVELVNRGNDTTTIKKVQSTSKEFAINIVTPFKIAPFSSAVVDATFTPLKLGRDAAMFTLKTDASNVSTVKMEVGGQSIKKGTDALAAIKTEPLQE